MYSKSKIQSKQKNSSNQTVKSTDEIIEIEKETLQSHKGVLLKEKYLNNNFSLIRFHENKQINPISKQ